MIQLGYAIQCFRNNFLVVIITNKLMFETLLYRYLNAIQGSGGPREGGGVVRVICTYLEKVCPHIKYSLST